MSVDNAEVVDLVVLSPKDEVFLIMVEARDWRATSTAIEELRAKFHAYARFVISGSLVRQYPEMATKSIAIRLDHFGPVTDSVTAELRYWAAKLSRIPVGVCSHRLFEAGWSLSLENLAELLKSAT